MTDFIVHNEFLAILNNFSGGALGNLSIMAMGISPYITASIVIQLLQMDIVPVLKEWNEQGEAGKQKTNRLTRVVALILAFIQALVLLLGLGAARGGALIPTILEPSAIHYIHGVSYRCWYRIAIYIGDLITKYGIGNGTSMLIVVGIVTSLPSMVTVLWNKYIVTGGAGLDIFLFILIMVLNVGILIAVTYLELAKRKYLFNTQTCVLEEVEQTPTYQ